jgi:hypothetical protein
MGRKEQSNLEVTATASPGRVVGRNPTFLNDSSVINIAMAQNMSRGGSNIGIGMGDLRTERATASFLSPNLSSSLLSSASSLATSNVATLPVLPFGQDLLNVRSLHGNSVASNSNVVVTGQGNNTNNDNDGNYNLFLQTLQSRQLLMNEAQRQQQAMNFLRPSNEISLLAQNEIDFQRRRAAAAAAVLGGGTSFGMSSFSHPRLGLASHGSLLLPSTATRMGLGLLDNVNNNNNSLQLLQLQLQQRATAQALLSLPAGPRDIMETDRNSGDADTSHREEPPG